MLHDSLGRKVAARGHPPSFTCPRRAFEWTFGSDFKSLEAHKKSLTTRSSG
jgi:hypothetical protein